MTSNTIKKEHATIKDGKIAIINGTRCHQTYCSEYGCDFPNCATFSGEEFDSIDDAKKKYKDIEIV